MTPYDDFLAAFPDYATTLALDDLRAAQFARLDRQDQVYLDYTGGGLYAASQVQEHAAMLAEQVLGNPHSVNPSSTETTRRVEQARAAVLDYFGGTKDYTAIFTLNASGALKLVGEAYPFAPGGRLLLTADNHNSVNGIREFAQSRGARVDYAPLTRPELRIDQPALQALLAQADAGQSNLFAFPAQSNFSGVKHPLDLVETARAQGWHVLLDAAAFVPTSRLDLRTVSPDFVVMSFYKMFGYPTGVGCLLVRNETLATLRRPWFGGGTVNFATVQGRMHVLSEGEAGFEDGTLNYLSIPAVETGLRHLQRVGIETIQTRVQCLTGWLIAQLLALKHGNGRPMVRLYGPASHGHARRHAHPEFLRPERAPRGLPPHRRAGGTGAHLAAHGVLLQSRRRRGGRGPGRRRYARGHRAGGPRDQPAALPARHAGARRQDRRRDPRLHRPGQQLCRCRAVHALCRRVQGPDRADRWHGLLRHRVLPRGARRGLIG